MRPQEIIEKKRDGGELSGDEIGCFIDGVVSGDWADYQITALIMAMFVRGMSSEEQNAITRAMLYSGEVLEHPDITKPISDKHSTGGVGDKTSLIIAPVVASCGVAVPMISGRGLGHTGGTLDKLESIKGYNVDLTTEEFRRVIAECGFAMTGQTADIAPADKKIYALRDATATVPYIPLIVASIMSKKMAEGLDSLVLDVKTGAGAFMPRYENSLKLAEELVKTGKDFGINTQAVVSDMSEPLGKFIGNAVEVYECLEILNGRDDNLWQDTKDLSVELAGRMLVLSRVAENIDAAKEMATLKIDSGEALTAFRQNIELQGGDASVCDEPEKMLSNLVETSIIAPAEGYISDVDALCVGNCVVALGGGRTKAEDAIDHAVGYACEAKVGDAVKRGQKLGTIFSAKQSDADLISEKMQNAYKIVAEPVKPKQLIRAIV